MTEYIEREAVKEAIGFIRLHHIEYAENKSLLDAINEIPAADVEPVRHGQWKQARYTEAPLYICSECDKPEYKRHKFCPNCGAKMKGES